MLDLVSIPLSQEKFRFVRLDGSLSHADRDKVSLGFLACLRNLHLKVLHTFSNNPSVKIMLISLKAGSSEKWKTFPLISFLGGVGLNLVAGEVSHYIYKLLFAY